MILRMEIIARNVSGGWNQASAQIDIDPAIWAAGFPDIAEVYTRPAITHMKRILEQQENAEALTPKPEKK